MITVHPLLFICHIAELFTQPEGIFAFSPHYSLHLFPSCTQAQLLHNGECVFTFPPTGLERTEILSDRWRFVLMGSIREASGSVKHFKKGQRGAVLHL